MRSQKRVSGNQPLGFVHTYPFLFESGAYIFCPVFLPSTQIRWKRSLKTHLFKTAPQTEEFLKRRFAVLVWMGVVWELLVRSLLIGRRKQWNVILPIALVLFGVMETHHWWLLFRGWMKTEVFENDYVTVLDISKCACYHQRWYRSHLLLRFRVDEKTRLHCDYCNRGHLDNVNQLDYSNITIHSKKVLCRPISTS